MKILNPDLIELPHGDIVILRLINHEQTTKLSKVEFEIIKSFSENNNEKEVINQYKESIIITPEVLKELIVKATAYEILIDTKDKAVKRRRIKPIFKRNKRIFEVFNMDFTNTRLEKFWEVKKIQYVILGVLAFAFSFMLIDLFLSPLHFKKNYMDVVYHVPYSFSNIIWLVFVSLFFTASWHELGHYLFYKIFNGKTSVFGVGFLYFFMPVTYTKILINTISHRFQRIIIQSGGIVFDIVLFVFTLYFFKHYHSEYPVLVFISTLWMTSIIIRSIFNLNPFLPGTDGYFIFEEAIKKPGLVSLAAHKTKALFNGKETWSVGNAGYMIYFGLSILFIFISWLFMFLPLISFLYYGVFKRS